MMRCLKDMTHHVARGDEYSWRAMQQMTQRLIKRLSALGQYEEAVAALSAVALERPASLKSKLTSAPRIDALSDRLSFIGPEEFIQTFALKDPLENHKGFFRKRKTSNLEAARAIEFFIDVAQECFNIGNFNSLMAIISQIVIPFFSLLIKDIYFLNEGCASRLTNGHINFEVSEFLVWRQVVCPFQRDRRILQFLVTSPVFNEDELHLASYESEGPENHMEKDSRRSLR
ncbi:hypothetical protein CRUP_018291 [Coryphaenoides rupestris]|nr:hypothetical protein CRUP_018291 [Coryphaenoides rupestris]